MKPYRYIILSLILILVMLFFACSKDKNNEETEAVTTETEVNNMEDDGEKEDDVEKIIEIEPSKTVWFFEDKPKGDWSIDIPYFNPFMTEDAYETVAFESSSELYVQYLDKFAKEQTPFFYGDVWEMSVPFNDELSDQENLLLLVDIRDYIQKLNGKVLGTGRDSISFECLENDVHWIGSIETDQRQFIIRLVRENLFPNDKELIIKCDEYPDGIAHFTSYTDGSIFQTLEVYKSSGEFSIDINNRMEFGDYIRRYDNFKNFYEYSGDEFFINELPSDPGSIYYEIRFEDNPPEEIKLKLVTQGHIPVVMHDENLGAIKVSAEYVESIYAYPTGNMHLSIDHPEFDTEDVTMDHTPDGDHIIFLPSGLWNVIITPKGDSLVNEYETKMIPVNSGQITEVFVPITLSKALKVASGFEETGIEISDVVENDNVTFRFSLIDKTTKEILPDMTNTLVYEGGKEGEIIDIKRIDVPPSVVLLLDSSGSMKGQMTSTLNAAKLFVEGLPDNTKIQVVDFDTEPKLLDGATKDTVLESLKRIKVGGATTLYDAIILGTTLLEDEERPTLVVFTDGQDANLNDTARGSNASYEELISELETVNLPIYTIGFGDNHDVNTLSTIADMSEGKYYSASDTEVLTQVFHAINSKLANTYDLTYKRPKEPVRSDMPYVSIVVDTSGSMGEYSEDFGERIINVQNLLHKFIIGLPKNTQVQITEFNDETDIVQTITTDKHLLLKGVSALIAGGGTDIEGSVEAAYETINSVPSSKKVLLYITDAALGTRYADEKFLKFLEGFKEHDISVLWIGIGLYEEDIEDFTLAAELSNGDYVVSEDVEVLNEKVNEMLNKVINAPDSKLTTISLNIEKFNNVNERETYTTSKLVELPMNEHTSVEEEDIATTETIHYEFSELVQQYDRETAEKISGTSKPADEIIISTRIKSDSKAKNNAAEITVNEIYVIEKLNGIEPPSNEKFLSLDLTIKNILPEQEVMVYPDNSSHPASWVGGGAKGKLEMRKIAYMIPSFTSHLYMNYNDIYTVPASTSTWLMEKPLVNPGNYSFTVQPDGTLEGMLTFLVPDEALNQCSLHFFDTNYGHINIPIVGVMKNQFEIEDLPIKADTNLNETFGVSINKYEDLNNVTSLEIPNESAIRLITGNFTSNVQALMDLDPKERVFMRVKSENGDFYVPLSASTALFPGGFIQARMIAPGANNIVKWAFEIPDVISDYSSELFMDLYEEDQIIEIDSKGIYPGRARQTLSHEYFNIHINDFVLMDHYKTSSGNYAILDLTIEDFKDSFSTSGVISQLVLQNDTASSESSGLSNFGGDGVKTYSGLTEELIFGFTDESVIYDGTSRRGFVVFELPSEYEGDYYLTSDLFEEHIAPVEGSFDDELLADKINYYSDDYFFSQLSEKIAERVEQFELEHPELGEELQHGSLGLDESEDKNNIPVPMISSYGSQLMDEINSPEEMIETFKTLTCLPGYSSLFMNTYSTEAFLTQGFGTIQDFATSADEILTSLGYRIKLHSLELTPRGQEVLETFTGGESAVYEVPGITYSDDGETRLLILPFMVHTDEVSDLVVLKDAYHIIPESERIGIEVSLIGEYTEKGILTQFSDMTDALSGDTEGDDTVEVTLFSDSLYLADLSLDAIDLFIASNEREARVMILTPKGEIVGDDSIDPSLYKMRELVIKVTPPDNIPVYHRSAYEDGMDIDQIFVTLSINAPEVSKEAAAYLNSQSTKIYQMASKPDELSSLKWYNRSMINEFIYHQTAYEAELSNDFDVITGRKNHTRIIAVSNKYVKDKILTTLDLVQPFNELHTGDEAIKKSYKIISGLYASSLEEKVVKNGYGLEEIWSYLPEDSERILLYPYETNEKLAFLNTLDMSEETRNYINTCDKYIIMPTIPAIIDGKKRWAWLEVNNDYETIAVLDNFAKGASVESAIVDTVKNTGQFIVGAFKGVETSVWSVAAFSLEESDYNVILTKAKAFALGISKNFGANIGPVGGSVGGTISASQNCGIFNVTFDGSFGMSQNSLGFTEGFVEGIKIYFDIAK